MDWQRLKDAVLKGDIAGIPAIVREAVDEGISAKDILDKGLIAGMAIVGEKFKASEIFVPEVLIAAKAMNEGLKMIEPMLAASGVKPKARVVIGTVKGDLHDIGKNLVAMMLKGAGFSIVDLGIDVAPEKFVAKVQEEKASLVAMSSLITTSMPSMKNTIAMLKAKGLDVKTIIGGAPVTQKYADDIEADGYAPDASSAVSKAKELLGI